MADALASGASARKGVWVQVPPSAPKSPECNRVRDFYFFLIHSSLFTHLSRSLGILGKNK